VKVERGADTARQELAEISDVADRRHRGFDRISAELNRCPEAADAPIGLAFVRWDRNVRGGGYGRLWIAKVDRGNL